MSYAYANVSVDILSLDHDLGAQEDGYWFVKQMIKLNLSSKQIFLHTANPVGRENMYAYLVGAQKAGLLPAAVQIHKGPIPNNQ